MIRPLELAPRVGRLAGMYARRLPPGFVVGYDDLYQVGMIAVHQAATRYNSQAGTQFSTFALRRASGAMLDELRAADPLARPHRAEVSAAGDESKALYQSVPFDGRLHSRASVAPSPLTMAIRTESAARSQALIRREYSGPTQRLSLRILLATLRGGKQHEIAAEFGCTQGLVSRVISDATKRLYELHGVHA